MFAELFAAAEVLSKIKDIKDLLTQSHLETVITFLEVTSDVHIRTAVKELRAAPLSTRPEEEISRAIGQLKVAATALDMSLERRPLLKRFIPGSRQREIQTRFRLTGCYLIITILYRIQNNMVLAGDHVALTLATFDSYAEMRQVEVRSLLFSRHAYNGGTDQAPLVSVATSDELRRLMNGYGVNGLPSVETLFSLAVAIVNGERQRLVGWLELP